MIVNENSGSAITSNQGQSGAQVTVLSPESQSDQSPIGRSPESRVPDSTTPERTMRRSGDSISGPSGDEQVSASDSNHFEEKIKSARIMIVDDERANVLIVQKHLSRAGYTNFVTTCDSRDAIKLALENQPDLMLLDINMPYVNGLDILATINSHPALQNTRVVILTADNITETKCKALGLGATDFLTKPIDSNELIPRVRNTLIVKSHFDQIQNQKKELEKIVQQRTIELYQSRQHIILSLARAAEIRDNDTGNHILRVGYFAAAIARQLGWGEAEAEMLRQASHLHDVGKIGIPDSILLKPGKLDENEYSMMKTHCAIGKNIISPFEAKEQNVMRSHTQLGEAILGSNGSPMMRMAARIASTHHEHFDGNGYPVGLAGQDIPIEGRITAVADVYDALSSKRPYKDAMPREKCFQILEEGRGKQFDPVVLDAFFRCSQEITQIQINLIDTR